MFLRSLGLMVVAASFACAAENLQIGILLSAPADLSAAVRKELQLETDRLFNVPGAQLIWKNLADNGTVDTYNRVVVMRLKGSCNGQPLRSRSRHSSLGITHVSDGRVLPFVEIDCTRIQEVLDQSWVPLTARMIGRALALVAVHELHHVLTASVSHDLDGVTKASFSRHDFLLRDLALCEAALQRLKNSLRLNVLETRAGGDQRPHTEE